MRKSPRPPDLVVRQRQRLWPLNTTRIQRWARSALPQCLAAARPGAPLLSLACVEVSLLSNRAIARVHAEFFADPSPTDVITFDHGEILVGAGIVSHQAETFGHTPTAEAALCVIHGLLHLAGWQDERPQDASAMRKKQAMIFDQAGKTLSSPAAISAGGAR